MMAGHARLRRWSCAVVAAVAVIAHTIEPASGQQDQDSSRFRFRTGVDLVNIAVTVTDGQGRFVPNLTRDDFKVFEDDLAQPISHFASERVPVSLGLAIDTSGSMAGEKIVSAREALRRFLEDLLGPDDEVFVYRFSDQPHLVQNWTSDRALLTRQLGSLRPNGGTAMYDTVSEAIPVAQSGQNRKKALVVISDGNDTESSMDADDLRMQIRQTEVLVYAIGIDGDSDTGWTSRRPQAVPPIKLPFPFPFPGGRRVPRPGPPQSPAPRAPSSSSDDGVNEDALRGMTDDSGGRTEIIRRASDLNPATARLADELSRQYFIGYPAAAKKDGRWHSIRVEVRNRTYHVRARRGYVAS